MIKTKEKASSYISVVHPFEIPLSKNIFFQQKKVYLTNFDMKKFVKNKIKHLIYSDFKENIRRKNTISEKIFSILTNKIVCCSTRKDLEGIKKDYILSLERSINKGIPITFNITQFAFKIPNPLKSSQRKPDLGELAFLSQLYDLTKLISCVYKPGAKFIIYGESYIFYKLVKIDEKEATTYFKIIDNWIKLLDWGRNLILYDLRKLESKVPNFRKEYQHNLQLIRDGLSSGDKKIVDEVSRVVSTLYTSINTRKYPVSILMKIYRKTHHMTSILARIKENLLKVAQNNSVPYLAYHKTINTSNLTSILFPNSLKLSFTPGPNKISLHIINRQSRLYPYHGVPLIDKDKSVVVKYEVDLIRKKNLVSYTIPGYDSPFYYKYI